MAVSCMRHASGDNYMNSLFIVEEAMGQIRHSTERISGIDKRTMQSVSLVIRL